MLPAYRAPFFDALAAKCEGGLSVFAGEPRPSEAIKTTTQLAAARYAPGRNRHYLRGPLYLCRQAGLIEWLEAWDPGALVVEANPRYLSTPAAVEWMHRRGRPVLGWGLGAPPLSGLWAGARRRSRLKFLRQLDGVISYSRRGAAEYRTLGLPEERVFVAYNAAAAKPQNPPPARPPHFKGQPVALFVGRLQARKRLDLLFRACAMLPEAFQPRLRIVGDGPDRALFERAAAADYPQTEFLGGCFGPDLDAIFTQADLFVLPGTGGLAVQQAMAHGLPVIVAQGDGTQEDLVRPGNGWLVPPDDLGALKTALEEALSDAPRLRRMGAESYRITAEEINLDTMADAFVRALNRVVR